MKKSKYTKEQEELAKFAKAIGHPTRLSILMYLASLDSCFFGEIHSILSISKATVSQHLKELKQAGLIQGEIEAPKVRYCINKDNWGRAQKMFNAVFASLKKSEKCCK